MRETPGNTQMPVRGRL
ncbi:hypothetical protein CRUP_029389 [Coryphaenoides rupestris]|nr:hypothetical protein CRUP_029389 [Coryphaenoides rupestris]